MTYCDLCGRGIPTVNPVRVFRPLPKFAYTEGVWKGLCENCLESTDKTRVKVEKEELAGTPDENLESRISVENCGNSDD